DERVPRVRGVEGDLAADRGAAEAVAVPADPRDDAVDQVLRLRIIRIAEAERVEERDGTRAHREDIAQDAADPGRGALERLDERRMVVALDLEDQGPPVADVNGARVLAGPLQHPRAGRREPSEENPRVLVRAVLGPEGREGSEFRVGRFPAEPPDDAIVFFGCQALGQRQLERDLWLNPRRQSPTPRGVPRGSPLQEAAVLDETAKERVED